MLVDFPETGWEYCTYTLYSNGLSVGYSTLIQQSNKVAVSWYFWWHFYSSNELSPLRLWLKGYVFAEYLIFKFEKNAAGFSCL